MGLGLTISKMIVQQMGGSIDVESVVGKGSNFHFTIPLLELPENSNGQIIKSGSKDVLLAP
jgi:signal transduction histidine kinase